MLASVKPELRSVVVVVITGAALLELALAPNHATVGEPPGIRDVLEESPL